MHLTKRGAWVVTIGFAVLFVLVSYIESVGTL